MSRVPSDALIRPPAVAGTFYPADPDTLGRTIASLLADCGSMPSNVAQVKRPRAMIAPHAGYVYSGPIAASAYAQLQSYRAVFSRVLIIGPAHRVAIRGIASNNADYFATPLGAVPVDRTAVEQLTALPFVDLIDEAHALEHSLEVHLPFLQTVLDEFSIIPLAFGSVAARDIESVFETVTDEQTLIIVSSDLSHFHDYSTANVLDTATTRAIERLDPAAIREDQACGRTAIQALLSFAAHRGWRPRTVDQRNSGDTAGSRDRVVGYGAYLFESPSLG